MLQFLLLPQYFSDYLSSNKQCCITEPSTKQSKFYGLNSLNKLGNNNDDTTEANLIQKRKINTAVNLAEKLVRCGNLSKAMNSLENLRKNVSPVSLQIDHVKF